MPELSKPRTAPFQCFHIFCIALLSLLLSPDAQALIIVTNNADSGPGSLRQAVFEASMTDTITFASTLSGQTILLTSGQIIVDKNLTIDGSVLANSVVINGNANGRIFQFSSGTTNVLNSLTLINGRTRGSDNAGGAICLNFAANLILNNSTLVGNAASLYGGGIYNSTSSMLTLNNSTLAGNSGAGAGGGIYIKDGTLTLNNSTLVGNSAVFGGGIYIYNSTGNATNSIVAGNTEDDVFGPLTGRFNLISVPAMLAPLGNYGGPTWTMPPLLGSPAIDMGGNTSLTTDQRGFARLAGSAVDIGAVEGIYNPAGPGTLTGVTNLGNGSLQFGFTNYTGMPYTVLASTNVAAPLNTWLNLGLAVETPASSGQFQFTDPGATNYPQRFYRVRTP